MAKAIQRCRTCRSKKGDAHKPFCRPGNSTITQPDSVIYITSVESGYSSDSDSGSNSSDSGSSSDSPTDCGGGGGGGE